MKLKDLNILASIFLICLSSNAFTSSLDYSNAAVGWAEDGYSVELALGGTGEENGFYGRALAVFVEDDYCYGGTCAVADGDLSFINVGYHWTMSETTDVILEGGYLGAYVSATACGYGSCFSESDSESGYTIMGGFRSGDPDGLEFKILIGRGDLVEADTIGQLELNYNFSEKYSLYLGTLYDGEDTLTMAGIKFNF
tara:strand:- start:356 stop:946 length:591 start_codon:yes stop_codon:yes gene_type:complete